MADSAPLVPICAFVAATTWRGRTKSVSTHSSLILTNNKWERCLWGSAPRSVRHHSTSECERGVGAASRRLTAGEVCVPGFATATRLASAGGRMCLRCAARRVWHSEVAVS